MSVGGDVYLACEGEEVLGSAYRCDEHVKCGLVSRSLELGFYPSFTEAVAVLRRVNHAWRKVLARRIDDPHLDFADLCPVCARTWERLQAKIEPTHSPQVAAEAIHELAKCPELAVVMGDQE